VIQAPDALLLTDGVVLVDRFTDADVDALWAGEDDGYVRRSRLPGPFTRRDIANQIRQWQDQWHLGGTGRALAIREAGSRRLVGGCVLEIRSDDSEIAELSYWVFPPYRRRGYASRAVELACRYAFDELGVVRMELYIEATNHASLLVASRTRFLREDLPGQRDRRHRGRSDMVLFVRLLTDSRESGRGAPYDLVSKSTHVVGDGSGRPPSADFAARPTIVGAQERRGGGRTGRRPLLFWRARSGSGPHGQQAPARPLLGGPPAGAIPGEVFEQLVSLIVGEVEGERS
jgi:RimJ/RimL family protein N-acetyltransferase